MFDETDFGPAMLALNERQRKFVQVLLMQRRRSYSAAAKAAGYSSTSYGSLRVQGHLVAHNPKVIAAIREHTRKRLDASALVAADVLFNIANDPKETTRERRAAASAILDRTGFAVMTEHRVSVDHVDRTGKALTERIQELAERLGMDKTALLGSNVVEAEFTVVENKDGEQTERPLLLQEGRPADAGGPAHDGGEEP